MYYVRSFLNSKAAPRKFRIKGKDHFLIAIEIYSDTDPDLSQVKKVEYFLHPSFKNRLQWSKDPTSNFRIEIWAWGTFNVDVTIYLESGELEKMTHDMTHNIKRKAW